MEDLIREWSQRMLKEQDAMIEDDLLRIFGSLERAKKSAKKIEVVYQHAPNGAVIADYRGIRKGKKWLIDRFPDWPISEVL